MNKVKLQSVIKLIKGKKPKNLSSEYKQGLMPYVDIKSFETGVIDKYTDGEKCVECKDGDLLIVCDGSRSGLIGKAIEGFVGSTLALIELDGRIDKNYLYYFIQGKYQLLNKNVKGTGTPHLKQDLLKSFEIAIPSLEIQKQIVQQIEESLSQLDSAVETLKKTKQQLEVYRQAVLKEAFEGRLSKHKTFSVDLCWLPSEETTSLPQIPSEWKYIKLSNLGLLSRGKSKHRPRNDKKLFENGKYPFIQTGDVKAADKYIIDYTSMYGDFGLQQSKLWCTGTLCITIAANIAETAFLGMDACFPDSIVGFVPKENILAEYIRYFIESQKLRLWAYAPATAQKNINLKTLENLIVPYCSLEEQNEIIRIIEEKMTVCLDIEKTVNQSLQQAEALRQSILKQAFEG